jgi:DNA polymerase-3 subunit delta'
LLKVIEEPGARTVWLLCAPTLTDVLPTIRSRCRHLTLRTPSVDAVTKLLIERDGIEPKMAEFASSAAQGHVGRARYLATNKDASTNREKVLNLPSTVIDLASAFEAINTLLEMAKQETKTESEIRNEEELTKLKESYGTTGSRLATGGSKAVKELEKEQKSRAARSIKNFLDLALLDIQRQLMAEVIENKKPEIEIVRILRKVQSLEVYRQRIDSNLSGQLMLEALFVESKSINYEKLNNLSR